MLGPEDLERTLKDIGTALGFAAIAILLATLSVYSCTAEAGEIEDGLAEAAANDFLHVHGVCMKAFEELNQESALVYYQCMAGGYGAKAEATIMRMKIEAAKSTSKEVKM